LLSCFSHPSQHSHPQEWLTCLPGSLRRWCKEEMLLKESLKWWSWEARTSFFIRWVIRFEFDSASLADDRRILSLLPLLLLNFYWFAWFVRILPMSCHPCYEYNACCINQDSKQGYCPFDLYSSSELHLFWSNSLWLCRERLDLIESVIHIMWLQKGWKEQEEITSRTSKSRSGSESGRKEIGSATFSSEEEDGDDMDEHESLMRVQRKGHFVFEKHVYPTTSALYIFFLQEYIFMHQEVETCFFLTWNHFESSHFHACFPSKVFVDSCSLLHVLEYAVELVLSGLISCYISLS